MCGPESGNQSSASLVPEAEGVIKDVEALGEAIAFCGLKDIEDTRLFSLELRCGEEGNAGEGISIGDGGPDGTGSLDCRLDTLGTSSSLDSSASDTGAETGPTLRPLLRRLSFFLCPGPNLLPKLSLGSGGGGLSARSGLGALLAFLLPFRECAGVARRETAGVFQRDCVGVVVPLGANKLCRDALDCCF